MPTADDITKLRASTSDDSIYSYMYKQDPSFRDAADRVRSANPQMNDLEQAKFNTAIINRHYLGSWNPEKTPQVPLATQSATAASESTKSILDPYTVEEMQGKGLSAVAAGGANFLKSGARLGLGMAEGALNVFNPNPEKNTLMNMGKLGLGAAANTVETVAGAVTGKNQEGLLNAPGEDTATQMGKFYKERYGSKEGLLKTLYEDPVGFLNDLSVAVGGAGMALKGIGKAGQMGASLATAGDSAVALDSTAAKIGQMSSNVGSFGSDLVQASAATNPALLEAKGAMAIAKGAKNIGKFATSQFSGLSPQTLETITREPQVFTDAQRGTITRGALAKRVSDALDEKINSLSDTGEVYQGIRASSQKAAIPTGWMDEFARKNGFGLDDTGNFVKTAESVPISNSELSALNEIKQTYFASPDISSNGVLNARSAMTELAKYGADRTSQGNVFFRELRRAFNDQIAHPQVDSLAATDAKYSPQIAEFQKLKKEWLTTVENGNGATEYVLKDNAISKIANMTKGNKTQELARLTKLVPGIDKEINALSAIEDVQYAAGQKVGTYARSAVLGGGVATGNVPAIVVSIVTHPTILIPILKTYGRVKGLASPVIDSIVSKMTAGAKLTAAEAAIASEAIQDASERYDMPDVRTMQE